MPLTEKGKETALHALATRRADAPRKIDNAALPAGSPMYFYCISCGHVAEVVPESYTWTPAKLCSECKALQELGWLE